MEKGIMFKRKMREKGKNMGLIYAEGTYDRLGVITKRNAITFTFEGEKEDQCVIVLVDKKSKEKTKIEVPKEYCLGSLRSITIEGIRAMDYDYYYEINGKMVQDPYAKAIDGRDKWMDFDREKNHYEILSGFVSNEFDWKNDKNPEIPKSDMVMYKLHVRGFSMDNGKKKENGTFQAIITKIPYFKRLNVTTLELMPVYEFEEMELPKKAEIPDYITWNKEEDDLFTSETEPVVSDKVNYWGYGEGNYFAVKASYARKPQEAAKEFKNLVFNLHQQQMELVMEMFFPDNMNQNMIMDILRFWVVNYHVDGFHLLGRNLPVMAIMQDIILSRTKIFYTDFPQEGMTGRKYKNLYVYKDEYQFPARKLLNHINPDMRQFLDQQRKQGDEFGYVNYIASNNGFTLYDLFMYNDKHNEDNGENNMDGENWNISNNYGIEGPTRKKLVLEARERRWINAMTMLFLGQGIPLLWEGDEICNSQGGNNNAYCQDNPVGWVNWKNEKKYKKNLEFLSKLTCFRKEHPILSQGTPYQFHDYKSLGFPDISYHGENAWLLGVDGRKMSVGIFYYGEYSSDEKKESVYLAYNFYSGDSVLALPKINKKKWYLVMDTSREEPFLSKEQKILGNTITLNPLSICILVGK